MAAMIRGLAIETSGRTGSVVLAEDGRAVAADEFPHGLKHAAELVPMTDRLCRARGWAPRDIREVYVSAGPGSFTGLRVGITVAKALALATGVKVVAVPTTDVLARNAPPEARHVVVVLDAKREQIFTARLARSDSTARWMTEEPDHLDTLTATLTRAPRPVHLIGEGIPYHQKFLPAEDPSVVVAPPDLWRPRAEVVAQIGHELARAGHFVDPQVLTPIYVRKPEAEEKYEERAAAAQVKH
jgi:tRNA threonylcarbamoyladenosine biosynthesis protein TsaB